ncbi:MAG: 5-methyltetrahydropteroyltriglutamate--homocysteine S-methyltransferase [Stellaceae bacterium]
MPRATPPFRADHVGSLLRPPALKEARAARAKGAIDEAALTAVEDREIERVIKKQEEIGLEGITDGELRRSWWHLDFLWGLGAERYAMTQGLAFTGAQTRAEGARITEKLNYRGGHPMIEHFQFLSDHASRTPKMTIPAPSALYGRTGREAVSKQAYPDLDQFFDALGAAYREVVHEFADAGCRYLQLDEVFLAMTCDAAYRERTAARGDDPERLAIIYADMINAAIAGIPEDMVVTMHLCRGNFRSTFMGTGGYDPVAEILFNRIKVDGYFLEYDSERAGDFAPLGKLPKDKIAVLGLVTTKSGKLETKDDLKRRLDEAAKYASLDQLCLSGQCGFASTEEGNLLGEEEQWAKLGLIVETADEVWG